MRPPPLTTPSKRLDVFPLASYRTRLRWRQTLGSNLQFNASTLDVQMSTSNSALIAVVTGNIKVCITSVVYILEVVVEMMTIISSTKNSRNNTRTGMPWRKS